MDRKRFLTAEWRQLAMLNYSIDPEVLKPRVPRGTELDSWNGITFVSVVGFLFLKTRLLGWPIPFHRDFEEVNLRFYVRRRGEEGWRRAVVFVKEIVPRWAIATVARLVYNENYVALPMRHRIEDGRVEYAWRFGGRWFELRVKTSGSWRSAEAGSEEEFITEHFWGYSRQRDGTTLEYRVEHPPWRVQSAVESSLAGDFAPLYGPEFQDCLALPPHSAFVAEGSEVMVRQGVGI
jgi:hypothetical protein